MRILVTGCAGFIGFHVVNRIIKNKKFKIYGIDNLNNNNDQKKIKLSRLNYLKEKNKKFTFFKIDLSNFKKVKNNFIDYNYDIIIHLAAEAGVRNSIKNPINFFKSNLNGFFNILECSRFIKAHHLIYASSSSVYGNSNKFPQTENNNTEMPESFYAASKKSNELMAYSYSLNYNLKTTGLRFFTVYGTYGREDMAIYKFSKSINDSKSLNLFNNGNHYRDFTYIKDVVDVIYKIIINKKKNSISSIYNIGFGKSYKLMDYLHHISKNFKKEAYINKSDFQKGDVYKTHSSVKKIMKDFNYEPKYGIDRGIKAYVKWFKKYYSKN